mgnify:FL=1
MKFNEFKKQLKTKLDILTPKAFEEEMKSYESTLKRELENGMTEEEIVLSFGSLDFIADNILEKRGIDKMKISHPKFLYKEFERLFASIHNLVDVMAKNDMKENAKIILDLLVLIVFICLLKIPFLFIQNIGDDLLLSFNQPILLEIGHFILEIVYIIVALMFFMNIFNKWFSNLKNKKSVKIEGKELEAVSLKESK